MAQIRSKQIKDFLSTVNWAETSDFEIANTSDIAQFVAGEISAVNSASTTAISSLQSALDAEILATNSDVSRIDGALNAEIAATNSEVIRIDGNVSAEASTRLANDNTLQSNIDAENARIDAILLASDADKDTFVEVVALINSVDLENDDALAAVILNLNAEIDSTNSDVTRMDNATAAEIAATNSDVSRIDAAHGVEVAATNSEITRIDGELSAEITATNSEVTSIDVRLGSVSGDLVETVDSIESALSVEISGTNSEVIRIDGSVSTEKLRAETAEGVNSAAVVTEKDRALAAELVLTNALSAEVTSTNSDVTRIDGDISAILSLSTADKDSFAEIVTLINGIDTVNDDALAAVILNLNGEISDTNSEVIRLDASVATEKLRAETAEGVNSAAVVTEKDRALAAELVLTNALAAEVSATNSEVTRLDGEDTAMKGRLVTLEASIMEDDQVAVETFAGAGFTYTLANAVQENQAALVDAFVNGHRLSVTSVTGASVVLANPGYTVDSADEVIFVYQY